MRIAVSGSRNGSNDPNGAAVQKDNAAAVERVDAAAVWIPKKFMLLLPRGVLLLLLLTWSSTLRRCLHLFFISSKKEQWPMA